MFKKKKKPAFMPRCVLAGVMPIPLTDRRYNNLRDLAETYDCGETVLATILTLANFGLIKTEPFEGDRDYDSGENTEQEGDNIS